MIIDRCTYVIWLVAYAWWSHDRVAPRIRIERNVVLRLIASELARREAGRGMTLV